MSAGQGEFSFLKIKGKYCYLDTKGMIWITDELKEMTI